MTTTHPIDHAIALLLIAFEGICWTINELAGFHAPLEVVDPDDIDPRNVYAIEADFTFYEDPVPFDATDELDWFEPFGRLTVYKPDLSALKVTELRRKAKGLAKGVHLMRKAELVALLA